MRINEAVTTNFDQLYELAAKVPFGKKTSVLPWELELAVLRGSSSCMVIPSRGT